MVHALKLTRRRIIAGLGAAAAVAPCRAQAEPYSEVFYPSGALRIQAYLYRPAGAGPFPAIIYNHGSRAGLERRPVPWVRLAGLYVSAGYAVLVPERRGYGKSDGPSWSETVGNATGPIVVGRCEAETDDVLAGADFLAAQPFVDRNRFGIVGWSLGGIVTLFAIARSKIFKAAVDQAGGVLTWRFSAPLRQALADAVRTANCPVLMMDAENDAAPEAIPNLAQGLPPGGPSRAVMYPPFSPSHPEARIAPGHLLFAAEGIPVWGKDAVGFLDTFLKR